MLGHAALSDVALSDLAAQNYARVRLSGISTDIEAIYIGPPIAVAVGVGTETDSANSAAAPIAVDMGASGETDSAGSAIPQSEQLVGAGSATETDSAQAASVALSLSSPIGTFEPGDTVQITINKVIDSLACSAGALTLLTNNGSIIEFLAPEPPLFGDKTLTYSSAITFTATADSESVDFDMPVQPRPGELFGEITSIGPAGIYADDVLNIGNFSHVKNITGDVVLDVSDGTHSNAAASSLEYALYDGVWSDYGTETFPAQDVDISVGSASETDSSQGATPYTPGSVNVGAGSETDSAPPVDVETPQSVDVGQAGESDTASSAGAKTVTPFNVGSATGSDTALGVTTEGGSVNVATGQASESDTAPTLDAAGSDQTIQLGTATESDTANGATPVLQNLDYIEPRTTIAIQHHNTTIVIQAA